MRSITNWNNQNNDQKLGKRKTGKVFINAEY